MKIDTYDDYTGAILGSVIATAGARNKQVDYFLGKYIYGYKDGTTIYVKSVDDLDDDSPTTLLTLTCAAFTPTQLSVAIRNDGTTLYVLTVFARSNAADDVEINTNYTTDLSAWTENVSAFDYDDSYFFASDIFTIGATVYAMIDGISHLAFLNFKTGAWLDDIAVSLYKASAGYVNITDAKYYWVYYVGGATDTLNIYSFDGTTIADTTEDIDSGTTDYDCDIRTSHFFALENGNRCFVCGGAGTPIDAQIFFYDIKIGSWEIHTAGGGVSTDHKVGVIWNPGSNIPNYIFVSQEIHKVGYSTLIRLFTNTSGYKLWGVNNWHGIYNGGNTLKFISPTAFTATVCNVNTALYQAPQAEIISLTAPFINQYLILYTDADVEFYEGYVKSYEDNTEEYKYTMVSGVEMDYNVKVDETFTDKTWSYILKYIIDHYCSFLRYGTATISAIPDTTYTITLSKSVLEVFKTADKAEGYIISVRPDHTVYWDQFTDSTRTVNPIIAPGITYDTPIKIENLQFARAIIYGGYLNGERLKSIQLGSIGFGTWQDWFAEITNQADLDLLAAQIVADRNVTIKKLKLGVITQGMFDVGTYYELTFAKYSIDAETWYILSQKYDAIIDESRFTSTDSYMSPGGDENTPTDQNTIKIAQNEQNIDNVEKKATWTWRDPAAYDFDKTDLVTLGDDTSWHDLDLSGVVGTKKMLVSMRVILNDLASLFVAFRTNGQTNAYNGVFCRTLVAAVNHEYHFIIETDSAGKIEELCSQKPSDWTTISIIIKGYKDA